MYLAFKLLFVFKISAKVFHDTLSKYDIYYFLIIVEYLKSISLADSGD